MFFSPEINLARYLQSIRKFPILTPEQEYSLAVKYRETKDAKIAQIKQSTTNRYLPAFEKVSGLFSIFGTEIKGQRKKCLALIGY